MFGISKRISAPRPLQVDCDWNSWGQSTTVSCLHSIPSCLIHIFLWQGSWAIMACLYCAVLLPSNSIIQCVNYASFQELKYAVSSFIPANQCPAGFVMILDASLGTFSVRESINDWRISLNKKSPHYCKKFSPEISHLDLIVCHRIPMIDMTLLTFSSP